MRPLWMAQKLFTIIFLSPLSFDSYWKQITKAWSWSKRPIEFVQTYLLTQSLSHACTHKASNHPPLHSYTWFKTWSSWTWPWRGQSWGVLDEVVDWSWMNKIEQDDSNVGHDDFVFTLETRSQWSTNSWPCWLTDKATAVFVRRARVRARLLDCRLKWARLVRFELSKCWRGSK